MKSYATKILFLSFCCALSALKSEPTDGKPVKFPAISPRASSTATPAAISPRPTKPAFSSSSPARPRRLPALGATVLTLSLLSPEARKTTRKLHKAYGKRIKEIESIAKEGMLTQFMFWDNALNLALANANLVRAFSSVCNVIKRRSGSCKKAAIAQIIMKKHSTKLSYKHVFELNQAILGVTYSQSFNPGIWIDNSHAITEIIGNYTAEIKRLKLSLITP